MADWTKPFEASYEWWRVARSSYPRRTTVIDPGYHAEGTEIERIGNIVKGTLQLNNDSETFETGTVRCVGPLDVGSDLIRCHLVATWDDGTTEDVVLGTYNVSVPSRDVRGSYDECSAILDGRLIELQEDAFEAPEVIPTGYNPAAIASGWVRWRGITFNDRNDQYEMRAATRPYTFGIGAEDDEGGTVLSALNAVYTQVLGLRAAKTDPYGRIMERLPIDYSADPVWTFSEGGGANFLSDAVDERDTSKVCNVVVCVFETEGGTIVGTAEDDDSESPWSIAAYGRRKVAVYSLNESPQGSNAAERQANADARAARLLDENRSIVRRVTVRHTYCPARVGDIVEVSYPSAGIFGKFAVRTQTIEVGSGGCMTTSELRRFERA